MRELYRRFGALLLLFLAVTFFLAVSSASARVRPITPCFAAQYALT